MFTSANAEDECDPFKILSIFFEKEMARIAWIGDCATQQEAMKLVYDLSVENSNLSYGRFRNVKVNHEAAQGIGSRRIDDTAVLQKKASMQRRALYGV